MFSLSFPSRISGNDRSSWGRKRTSNNGASTSILPVSSMSGTSTPRIPSTSPSHTSLADSLQSNPFNAGGVSLAPPLAAYLHGRSVSTPTTPSPPKATPRVAKHSSLQSPPTQPALKVDPRIMSVSDAGTGTSKMLSPIVEQDYFSPARRSMALPVDNPMQTQEVTTPPISESSDAPRSSPVYSTFLARPLKRSISQMSQASSRTHMSTVSAPPTIPPIDFLPIFSGHLDSWRTPSSVVSGSHECSGTYEDSSSLHPDSFISAQSATPSPPYPGPETGQGHTPYYSPADVGSLRSATTDGIPYSESRSSSSSSYVGRRWTTSLSFGSDLLNFQTKSRESQKSQSQTTPACLLFWLGFVAPWCWMIGGWMLTRGGKTRAQEGSSGGRFRPLLLPLWNSRKTSEKGIEGGKVQEGYTLGKGYPFVAPSVDTLARSNDDHKTQSQTAPNELDPWVRRCRKASVVSGFALFVIFIVVCVIIGRREVQ